MTTRRRVLIAFGAGVLAAPIATLAQQRKVWRIGMLETISPALNSANLDALRRGLGELGYVEGQNIVIEYRSADGQQERFPELASELVRLKVDLIVTRGTPAALAAKNATSTIPIIIIAAADPVASGVVASLARPGGNVTGLSALNVEIYAKRVELLRELVPKLARVACMFNITNPSFPPQWKAVERAGKSLGVEVLLLDVRTPEALKRAFDVATRERAQALMFGLGTIMQANRRLIIDLAAKHRLPAIYGSSEFVDAGGLISYAVSFPYLYYRAATYMDRIVKGAKPADLPVEQPTKFELVVNQKTAKTLGIAIPQSLIFRADRVIE
jgi:putative ABC transport system substrate-binding protein